MLPPVTLGFFFRKNSNRVEYATLCRKRGRYNYEEVENEITDFHSWIDFNNVTSHETIIKERHLENSGCTFVQYDIVFDAKKDGVIYTVIISHETLEDIRRLHYVDETELLNECLTCMDL